MIPLALGKEEYVTKIAAPFAITVIGGLTLSTVFTLILIPTVYSGLENFVDWIKGLDWKIKFVQVIALILGSIAIYYNIENLILQFVLFFSLLFFIPGITRLHCI